MIHELLTSSFSAEVAEDIDRLAKSVGLVPCKWCEAEPANFIAGLNGMMNDESLYCGACGRFTFQYLKVRQIMARMACKWFGSWNAALLPFLQGTGEWQLCGHSGEHRYAVEAVIRDGIMGTPDEVLVKCNGDQVVTLSHYDMEKALSRVVNQAVLVRLGVKPELDIRSRFGCPHCGAPESEQEWRNMSQVLRTADIYCTRCGEYVREWDPN